MKKNYPWGVDAEEKPRSKEDCRQIVHSMAKLKLCVKGLAKRDNQLKAVAATMYAIMKEKSADFRAQTGNRYTKTSLDADEACAKLEVASCDHTSAVNESNKLADRASGLRKTDERRLRQKTTPGKTRKKLAAKRPAQGRCLSSSCKAKRQKSK